MEQKEEIAFFPSPVKRTRTLSQAQVTEFNELGYISPLDALTPAETTANRTYFDNLLAQVQAFDDGRNAYSIMGYQNYCRGIWDLAQHPGILDYVEDLLGPDFVCWSTHYFCKLAQESKHVPWHQDATYWPVRPTKTVTVWLAIDDVDQANSPMRFIPGSHLLGGLEWRKASGDFVLHQEIPDAERYGRPYDNILKAGQISLHASTLIHGSEPNRSDRRRCGLTFRYIPSDCGVLAGAERILRDAVVCRGDPRHWIRTRRPADDDVRAIHHYQRD
jgi:ectoine hydroxylase-related dioxygenase (phytanoyl-CoA dioxygenase family)